MSNKLLVRLACLPPMWYTIYDRTMYGSEGHYSAPISSKYSDLLYVIRDDDDWSSSYCSSGFENLLLGNLLFSLTSCNTHTQYAYDSYFMYEDLCSNQKLFLMPGNWNYPKYTFHDLMLTKGFTITNVTRWCCVLFGFIQMFHLEFDPWM